MSEARQRLEPLQWPVDWSRLGLVANFFRDVPVIGLYARTKKRFCSSLATRDLAVHKALWEGCCVDYDMILSISELIQQWLRWPNPYFIPEDPCEIVLWDPTPYMDYEGLALQICNRWEVPASVFDNVSQLNFGQFMKSVENQSNASVR